jgi:TctA family transporter
MAVARPKESTSMTSQHAYLNSIGASVFFTHPISLTLLIIAALLVIVPLFLRRRVRHADLPAETPAEAA